MSPSPAQISPYLCLASVLCLAPSACYTGLSGATGSSLASEATTEPDPPGATIELTVLTRAGQPIPRATIHLSGLDLPGLTDADGVFTLVDTPTRRIVARVNADGFAPGGIVLELAPGTRVDAVVTLLELVEYPPFDAERGGLVDTDTVRLDIPAGALYDPSEPDRVITGPVVPTIVPLDPTTDLAALPGPLRTDETLLESLFMAEISLWQAGRPLQIRSGKAARVALRLPEGLARTYRPGDRIPAWSYSFDEGAWLGEPDVDGEIRTRLVDNTLWWHADLPHFTWWNADVPVDEIGCVQVHVHEKVKDQKLPIANALVTLVGLTYNGIDTAVTDAQGLTCLEMPFTCKDKDDQDIPCEATLYFGTLNDPYIVTYPEPVQSGETPGTCGGDCPKIPFSIDGPVCAVGDELPCGPYNGPPGTLGLGICRGPKKSCNPDEKSWGECQPAVLPEPPICANQDEDVDCDGVQPEGEPGCPCVADADCYTGPPGTETFGICHRGTRPCVGGTYSNSCNNQQTPKLEDPKQLDDEDCDGLFNENDDPFDFALGIGGYTKENAEFANEVATDMVIDGKSLYLVGWFTHEINLGPNCQVATNLDHRDVFVARFDLTNKNPVCTAVQVLRTGGPLQSDVRVAITPGGGPWVLGQCAGQVALHPNGAPVICTDSFVAKFDPALQLQAPPSALPEKAVDLATVSLDLYAIGDEASTTTLRIHHIDPNNGFLVVPYDIPLLNDGVLVSRRVERLGKTGIAVAGTYQGKPLAVGAPASAGTGAFVVRIPDPKQPQLPLDCAAYMPAPVDTGETRIEALSTDLLGTRLFLGGGLQGALKIPPNPDIVVQLPDQSAAIMMQFDAATCTVDWIEAFGATGAGAEFRAIAQGGDGHVYSGGFFAGTIILGGAQWSAKDTEEKHANMFLVQRANGAITWSAAYGGLAAAFEAVHALVPQGERIYAAGQHGMSLTLGPGIELPYTALADAFLARFVP